MLRAVTGVCKVPIIIICWSTRVFDHPPICVHAEIPELSVSAYLSVCVRSCNCLSISAHLSVCLCQVMHPSVCICPFMYLCQVMCLSVKICPFICPLGHASIFLYLPIYLCQVMHPYVDICPFIYLCQVMHPSVCICPFIYLLVTGHASVYLYLPIYLSVMHLSVSVFICVAVYFQLSFFISIHLSACMQCVSIIACR